MGRYISVFYDTKNKKDINKTNKKVIVFECDIPSEVKSKILADYKTDLIKSIRDLEKSNYWLYNRELMLIEDQNNFRL